MLRFRTIFDRIVVIVREFFECRPLLAIVPEDDQGDVLSLRQIEQFARAGDGTRSIGVHWAGLPIGGEIVLSGDGVDGEEHWAGLGEVHEDRLVARNMSTGLDEFDAGKQFGIALDQAVPRGGLIPLRTSRGGAWVTIASYLIVLVLDDELCVGEGGMIARVIDIVVRTDERIDGGGPHADHLQLFNDVASHFRCRHVRRDLEVRRQAAVNQNIVAIAGLNEIAGNRYFEWCQ